MTSTTAAIADSALYRAKEMGRACTLDARPEPEPEPAPALSSHLA